MDNPLRFIDPDGMAADSANKKKPQPQQTGSYTVTYENGMKYHGKGSLQRAKQSAKEHATEDNPVAENGIDWTPADSKRQAFKDEDDRMNTDEGGNKSDANYNKNKSPGAKYNEEDKKKAEAEKRNTGSEEPDASTTPANNFSPSPGLHPVVKKVVIPAAAGITLGTILYYAWPLLLL
jgi:hypothetical protein